MTRYRKLRFRLERFDINIIDVCESRVFMSNGDCQLVILGTIFLLQYVTKLIFIIILLSPEILESNLKCMYNFHIYLIILLSIIWKCFSRLSIIDCQRENPFFVSKFK